MDWREGSDDWQAEARALAQEEAEDRFRALNGFDEDDDPDDFDDPPGGWLR